MKGHMSLYGVHAVLEALERRPKETTALLLSESKYEDAALLPIRRKAQALGIAVIPSNKATLDAHAQGAPHQGVVALCGEYHYTPLEELVTQLPSGKAPLFLVLDGVTDPQNLGALIRSAYLMGAHGVVFPQDRSAAVTPAVIKAASGATEWLPLARVPNLVRAMQFLQEQGVWLYGASLHDSTAKMPWHIDWTGPVGLVLGSEGQGMRPLVRKTCDGHIYIPMQGRLHGSSLNVSASGAMVLYEVARQRVLAAEEPSKHPT